MNSTIEIIEEIVARELKTLCCTCAHFEDCVYRKTTSKAVIQCELFEVADDESYGPTPPAGLCSTCDHADYCKLPGRKDGVWRCDEFA